LLACAKKGKGALTIETTQLAEATCATNQVLEFLFLNLLEELQRMN